MLEEPFLWIITFSFVLQLPDWRLRLATFFFITVCLPLRKWKDFLEKKQNLQCWFSQKERKKVSGQSVPGKKNKLMTRDLFLSHQMT